MPDGGDALLAQRLDSYWDEVLRETPNGPEPRDLDPGLEATVRRIHLLDAAPAADPVFASRLWEDLMRARFVAGGPNRQAERLMVPPGLTRRPRRATSPRSSTRGGRWAFAQLVTAALLVVTLLASYVAFGPLQTGRNDDGRPAAVPASTGLGLGVLTDEVLARATVRDLPASASWVGLERHVLEPGADVAVGLAQDEREGAYLVLVESGAVTLRADGPVTVARAGAGASSQPTPVVAGTEVVLGIGDQGFVPSGVTGHWRNDGATAAGLLGVAYFRNRPTDTQPVLVDEYRYVPPALPVVLTLRRLTLAAGTSLPIADVVGLEMIYVETGKVEAVDPGGPGTPPSTVPIRAGAWADDTLPAGRVLHVLGETPAVLLLVTFSPIDPAV